MTFGERNSSFGGKPSRSSKPRVQRTPEEKAERQAKRETRKANRWPELTESDELFVPLTEPQIKGLTDRAFGLCVWHLGQSSKTRAELAEKLVRKNVPASIIEVVLERLEKVGYLDDTAFAEQFVRSRHSYARKGAQAIRFELRRKGVDDETAAVALEQITPESELEAATELVRRKLRSTARLDRQKRTQRLVGMLARKGYGGGIAWQVVRDALDNEDSNEEDDADFDSLDD